MANFPTTIDNGTSLPNPTGTSTQASPDHAALHTSENGAIIAVETKLGIGASTPSGSNLLVSTGTGTSAWSKAAPTGTIVGTTDSQTLTNKVLTSPTINTPTITNATLSTDAITGFSVANTGTVYGVPVSAGVITTANTVNGASLIANSVAAASIVNSSLTATQIATGAATLSKLDLSAMGTISSTVTSAAFTGGTATTIDTLTFTIPTGCTKVYIFGSTRLIAADATLKDITCWIDYDSATSITKSFYYTTNAAFLSSNIAIIDSLAVTAGSHTFRLRASASAGATGGTVGNRTIFIIPAAA